MLLGVVFITVGLSGGPVTPRTVFSVLSLSWGMVLDLYRQNMLVVDLIDGRVSVLRIQVRVLLLLLPASVSTVLWVPTGRV